MPKFIHTFSWVRVTLLHLVPFLQRLKTFTERSHRAPWFIGLTAEFLSLSNDFRLIYCNAFHFQSILIGHLIILCESLPVCWARGPKLTPMSPNYITTCRARFMVYYLLNVINLNALNHIRDQMSLWDSKDILCPLIQ